MENRTPVGFRFSVMHRAMKKQMDEYMKSEGLTGVQLFVLSELRRLEVSGADEVNQRDLEKVSRVTHPTMTDILKRLEKKGYILCCRSQLDRRYKSIASTEKARGLKQELEKADELAFRLLCAGLSEEQIAQLNTITEIMVKNAADYLEKGCDNCNDKDPCQEPAGI